MNLDFSRPVKQELPAAVREAVQNAFLVNQWDIIPLYTTPAQNQIYEKCMALFAQAPSAIKPSALVELDPAKMRISETACMIDKLFEMAVFNYKNKLDAALYLDCQSAALNIQIPNLTVKATIINAGRAMQYAPTTPVIKHIALLILAFSGAFGGLFITNSIKKELTFLKQSDHRQAWLTEVTVLEKNRIEQAINLISARVTIIHQDLQEGEFVNTALLDELKILERLYTFFNQASPLIINGKTVPEYIQETTRRMQLRINEY